MGQATVNVTPPNVQAERVSGPWRDAWKAFRKNKTAMLGLCIIVFFVLIALLAPFIAPYGYKEQELVNRLKPPSAAHWLWRPQPSLL